MNHETDNTVFIDSKFNLLTTFKRCEIWRDIKK